MLLVLCQRRARAVAAVDLHQTVGGVVIERDLGIERPLAAAGQAAAQEGGAAELVLLLPAEPPAGVVALAGGDDRGGQAVVVVGGAAVGRARTGGAGELKGEIQFLMSGNDHYAAGR